MKKYLFFIAVAMVLFSCNGEGKYESQASSDAQADVTDSTATDTTGSPKIIKTADMRFRVKDVQQTKEQLTTIIKSQGGSVAEFSIQSLVQETDKVSYSLDSLKEITAYRKEGRLVAKIPSEKLDDFTNMIAKSAVFVDQQSMKMDDQSLAYLANKLKVQNRAEALKAINQRKTKNGNVETSMYIKDDYVDKKIENMNIDNRVKFSTITLDFYQDNTIHTTIIGNDRVSDYGPGFFKRVGLNLWAGWSFLKEFILGLITLWPFIGIVVAAFFVVRHLVRRNRLKNEEATRNLINNTK
jgi:hypothetical protein